MFSQKKRKDQRTGNRLPTSTSISPATRNYESITKETRDIKINATDWLLTGIKIGNEKKKTKEQIN